MPQNTIVVNQGDLNNTINVPHHDSYSAISFSLTSGAFQPTTNLPDNISSIATATTTTDTTNNNIDNISTTNNKKSMEEDNKQEDEIVTSTSVSRAPFLNDIYNKTTSLTRKDNDDDQEIVVSHGCDLGSFSNVASNKGWGIPNELKLRGGGLNSLNNGTSGWGAPPNTAAAASTGWGIPQPPPSGGPVGPSSTPPGSNSSGLANNNQQQQQGGGGVNPSSANNNQIMGTNQWASSSTSPNRNNNTSQNTNGQPLPGSQMNSNPSSNAPITTNNPSGLPMPMGNMNNTQQNSGSGISTTAGSNNPACTSNKVGGLITPSSSWAQAAGKSLQTNTGNNQNATIASNNNQVGSNPMQQQQQQGTQSSMINPGGQQQQQQQQQQMNSSASTTSSIAPPNTGGSVGGNNNPTPSSVTSKQIEQLNNMREALFSHDGWGGNVNQDSSWDIPGSPEPKEIPGGIPSNNSGIVGGPGGTAIAGGIPGGNGGTAGPSGPAAWKANNGTDLWEANLRNGGAPPAPVAAVNKPSWGHTPTTNIGGTWGEEDDSQDNSNVWTGVPPNNPGPNCNQPPPPIQQQQPPPQQPPHQVNPNMQWGMNQPPPQQQQPQRDSSGNQMWPSPVKKENPDWNNGGIIGGRGMGMQQPPMGGGMDPGYWNNNGNNRMNSEPNNMMDHNNPGMWNKPPQQPLPPPQQQQQQNQWNAPPPPNNPMMGMGGQGGMGRKESGWSDEISPPPQRRVITNNYDDGTSLWGNPMPGQPQPSQQQQPPRGMPPPQNPRGMLPNKMDGGMINRNGGWQGPDQNQDFQAGGPGWDDKNNMSWGEPPMQQNNSWGKPKTPTNVAPGGWGDDGLVDTTLWGAQPKSSGNIRNGYINGNFSNMKDSRDKLWSSTNANYAKSIKSCLDLGYKKEDIELALRSSNMNISDAIDSLDNLGVGRQMDGPWGGGGGGGPMGSGGQQGGRRGPNDDHFDLNNLGHPPPPQQRGFPGGNNQFPGGGGGGGGANGLNNVANNPAASLASINQTLLQRILTHQQSNNTPQQSFNANRATQPTNAAQLRILVQQIQMAVQAGYLNSQILQHPLPQQSLYLLNQLLQQIKLFQQLTQAQQQMGKANNAGAALQLSVQITKTKQQITNLHNQIAAQQAQMAKQQQQQQQHNIAVAAAAAIAGVQPPQNDFFKNPSMGGNNSNSGGSGMIDSPMSAIQTNNFSSEFGKDPGHQQQQHQQQQQQQQQQQRSRLDQWTSKVPSDKDDSTGNEFSRAPGGGQSNNLLKNNSSLILGQNSDTWSTVTPSQDGWPTDSNSASSNNSTGNLNDDSGNKIPANSDSASWLSDFVVPEFTPGKPWKGTQILKSVEDDPTLTPGSVVRSPLSLAAIKDASEIFTKSSIQVTSSTALSSETLTTPLSLNSTTWSFTPTSSSAANPANPQMTKVNPAAAKGASWTEDNARPRDSWEFNNTGGQQQQQQQQQGSTHRPPPGLQQVPKKTSEFPVSQSQVNPTTTTANTNSFAAYRPGQTTSNQSWGSNGSGNFWLLLRNLTPQIDGSTLKTLCMQHGPLQKFHLYLGHGIALVKYSSREEATKAQKTLNNCVLGNTTILAETASESDVLNIHQGLSGSSLNNNSTQQNSGGNYSANSGATSSENPWGRDSSPLWNSSPWGEAPDRATPSSLNSLIPGDLI